MVSESLPALPVIVLAAVAPMTAVTPVPVLADASSVVMVEPSVPAFRPIEPVTLSLVAAAVVRVASTLAVLPSDCNVRVSTPATVRVAAPDTLLITTVAESAEPVTSLNVTT